MQLPGKFANFRRNFLSEPRSARLTHVRPVVVVLICHALARIALRELEHRLVQRMEPGEGVFEIRLDGPTGPAGHLPMNGEEVLGISSAHGTGIVWLVPS